MQNRPDIEQILPMKLRTARFQHLLRQYGHIVKLGEDAADKQSGEYILDKQYIIELAEKAFESADSLIYDLNIMTGQRYADFYDTLENLHRRTKSLLAAAFADLVPARDGKEETEYRLLKKVREILFGYNRSMPPQDWEVREPIFYSFVENICRKAADSHVEFMRSLSRESLPTVRYDRLPVESIIVDLTDPTEPNASIRSSPLSEFVDAFATRGIWPDPQKSPARLVAVGFEDSIDTAILFPDGSELLDACLSCASDSNHIYYRFSFSPAGSGSTNHSNLAAGILERLGFSTEANLNGVTGWSASQPLRDTAAKLRATGKMSGFLAGKIPVHIPDDEVSNSIESFFELVPGPDYGA